MSILIFLAVLSMICGPFLFFVAAVSGEPVCFLIGTLLLIFGIVTYYCIKSYGSAKNAEQKSVEYKAMLNKQYTEAFKRYRNETRILFRKYGIDISDSVIFKISEACEQAHSQEELAKTVFSFIPDNIPTLVSINAYTTLYADKILKLCPNEELKLYLKEQLKENIAAIKEADLQNIYNAQKSACHPEQTNLYRFDYEQLACSIIFSELINVSPFLFSRQDIDNYQRILLDFGEKNGYSLNPSTISSALLNETIEHFKTFFKKYGVEPSPEEIANIMTQYAMAQASDDEPDLLLFDFIPNEIPSRTKFIKEISYHINNILSNIPDSIVSEQIIDIWDETAEATAESLIFFYNAQKSNYELTEQTYFRFNYELRAITVITAIFNDLSDTLEDADEYELEPLNEFLQSFLKIANNLGYTKND